MIQQAVTKTTPKGVTKDVKEGLGRPLLLNFDSDEANNDYRDLKSQNSNNKRSQGVTPRKTPRDLMPASDQKMKGVNMLKQGL